MTATDASSRPAEAMGNKLSVCQVFLQKNLTRLDYSRHMPADKSTARLVRDRVRRGRSRYWKHSDFEDLPPGAVAAALSRLARDGTLQRVGKGVYYRPASTAFGPSVPSQTAVSAQTLTAPVYPAGLAAANVLGLSTQNPGRIEYATPAPAPPTALRGAIVHTRRPPRRVGLPTEDVAILEVLRERARSSDLAPPDTVRQLRRRLSDQERFTRLVEAAVAEPPRVRAMLGALGQELEMPPVLLDRLKVSLNPLSRFDFGQLRALRHAKEWQAK